MSKTFKVLAVVAFIAILASPVFGQTTYNPYTTDVWPALSSNTKTATAGIFSNDVDNFINYHNYSKVKFDKGFGYITGKNLALGAAELGYATKFGENIYFGTWYRGNIYRLGGTGAYETHTITPAWDDSLEILNSRTDTTSYNPRWNESTNNFEFLIGVAGQGIKVGFFESAATNKAPGTTDLVVIDYLNGRKRYTGVVDEYSRSVSYLKPYLGWGSTFAVSNMKLMPYVDFAFNINGDKTINNTRSYDEVNGVRTNEQAVVGAGRSAGVMILDGTIGAKMDLEKKETKQTTLGLAYRLQTNLYNNKYDATGLSGDAVKGTVTWGAGYVDRETKYTNSTRTETDITLTITEPTDTTHIITPLYKITGEPGENFKVGFQATLPVTIRSQSTGNGYNKRIAKEEVKYNDGQTGYKAETENINYSSNYQTDTSTLGINLNLAFGASYQLIPGRFGINAGIAAQPIRYSHATATTKPNSVASISTTKVTEDDGSVTQDEKTVTMTGTGLTDTVAATDTWQQYTASLGGGFTFNFTPNSMLDLAVNSGTLSANAFNLDLATVNVIFTLKF